METHEQNGVSPTPKTTEQQLIDLLQPLLESAAVTKAAGQTEGYRTVSVELERCHDSKQLLIRVWPGYNCQIHIEARSWAEVEEKLLAYDPVAATQKRIDDLKKELAMLQAGYQPA